MLLDSCPTLLLWAAVDSLLSCKISWTGERALTLIGSYHVIVRADAFKAATNWFRADPPQTGYHEDHQSLSKGTSTHFQGALESIFYYTKYSLIPPL